MPGREEADLDIEEAAHFLLQVGRLLLADGADTEQVRTSVDRLALVLGCEAHLLVTYESLLLTLAFDGRFRTKVGRHLPAMGVNMRAVEEIGSIVADMELARLDLPAARVRLDRMEQDVRGYPRVAVIAGMGVTTACLARLFGGDLHTCAIVLVAGAAGMWLRQVLGHRNGNPFLVAFLAAFFSGAIGALGVWFAAPAAPALCLIAPGMIIVPGVPLINGIWDCIRNHMGLGMARLGAAALTILAITVGLFCVTLVTGVSLPVGSGLVLLPLPEDAIFAGIAAIGYALLFNVPPALIVAAVACGAVSHSLRTAATMAGLALAPATLVGALAAGMLTIALASRFRVPPAAFAFPGVVAMVPGSFAFRAVIGSLQIVEAGANASHELVAETAGLVVGSAMTMAAIAIGLALPLALIPGAMQQGAPGEPRQRMRRS